MSPPRTRPDLVVELELKNLREPAYHDILFLSNPDTDNSSLPETIIKVRPLEAAQNIFEIITGVEQFRAAREQGARTIPAIVKEMTAQEARRYATDELLRTATLSAARPTVQLLVAARDNEAQGGDWSVERFTKQIGIKKSTCTHAWSSVNYVCHELRKSDPEAADLGLAELVARAVRTDFMRLSLLCTWAGWLSISSTVSTTERAKWRGKEASSSERRRQEAELKNGRVRRRQQAGKPHVQTRRLSPRSIRDNS